MNIEKVVIEDAKELLSIYAPYVKETAISFEYEVPCSLEGLCGRNGSCCYIRSVVLLAHLHNVTGIVHRQTAMGMLL